MCRQKFTKDNGQIDDSRCFGGAQDPATFLKMQRNPTMQPQEHLVNDTLYLNLVTITVSTIAYLLFPDSYGCSIPFALFMIFAAWWFQPVILAIFGLPGM